MHFSSLRLFLLRGGIIADEVKRKARGTIIFNNSGNNDNRATTQVVHYLRKR